MSHAFLDAIQSGCNRKTYKKGMRPIVPMPRPTTRTAPNVQALTLPTLTAEAGNNPARAKAEREGFASFGRRTWFLVEREGRYRAVETMDDAPGWSLVERMKR
jgi:hypothetical protein